MHDPFTADLQRALGERYTIDRELGGGGMSRVYLATETALGRAVVLKLLPPELAADLSVDRFRREIRVAARLQHPCVVPVLATGDAAGVPYYTMPYVAGDSLRRRLERPDAAGGVPISEALGILRDIARALAHAHDQGIVHRDIKPENVLLAEGSAVVTDFGIAKALMESRAGSGLTSDGPVALTGTGMSLGTPAYMAPEQAAADPSVDHRADLYALGVVGYELLTGRPPFHGLPPQRMVAAVMSERPPDVARVRAEVPPVLGALVMGLLDKEPVHRPARADEVVRILDEVRGTGGRLTGVGQMRRSPWFPVAAAAGVAVLLGGGYLGFRELGTGRRPTLREAGAMAERDLVIVTEFNRRSGDSLMADVASEAFRIELAQSSFVRVLPPATVAAAMTRMQRKDGALDAAAAREVALREGAKAIVDGSVSPVGAGWLVRVRLLAADSTGTELAAFTETADSPKQVVETLESLARTLRKRMGESLRTVRATPPLEQTTTASLEALQQYTAGVRAVQAGNHPAAAERLRAAVSLDTGFAMGHRLLGIALYNSAQEPTPESDSAFARAHRHLGRLSERERYLTIASYHQQGPGRDRGAAARAHAALLRLDSTDSRALNNLAVSHQERREFDRALALLQRIPSPSALHMGNAVRMFLNVGDVRAADSVLTQLQGRFPESPMVLVSRLLVVGAREPDSLPILLRTLRTSPSAQHRVNGRRWEIGYAMRNGRPGEAERLAAEGSALEREVNPSSVALFSLEDQAHLIADAVVRERADRVVSRIEAVTAGANLDTVPPTEGYLYIAMLYAMANEPARARTALTRYERAVTDTARRRAERNEYDRALGDVLLSEGRPREAVDAYWRSDRRPDGPATDCLGCVLGFVARAWDRAGVADSAIANYEAYLATPYPTRWGFWQLDPMRLANTHQRLGELYEERGDLARARQHYEAFTALWAHAEPELQPRVRDVRARTARIDVRRRRDGE